MGRVKLLLKHLRATPRTLPLKLSLYFLQRCNLYVHCLLCFALCKDCRNVFLSLWCEVMLLPQLYSARKKMFLIAKTETCRVGKLSKLKLHANPGLLELRLSPCRYRTFSRRLYLSFYAILQYILICRYCYLHFLCLFHCCLTSRGNVKTVISDLALDYKRLLKSWSISSPPRPAAHATFLRRKAGMKMNEWINAWMNEWMNKWMNEAMNECTDKFATFQHSPFSENPDARNGQETQDVDTALNIHKLTLGQFLIFS